MANKMDVDTALNNTPKKNKIMDAAENVCGDNVETGA